MKAASSWVGVYQNAEAPMDLEALAKEIQLDALESAAEIADDSLLQNEQIAAGIRRLKPC